MHKEKQPYVCPAEFAGTLDNSFRRLVHKPGKILGSHVKKGMTVLDLGCGPGYFTIELARLVGEEGKVIAADLQQAMLDKVKGKIRGSDLEQRISLHKCQGDMIGISQKVDFVLAFWMIHEVPDQMRLFWELKTILNPVGRIWIVEPKMHVSGKAFNKMIVCVESAGLVIIERPKVSLSRSVLLSAKQDK